MKLKTLFTVTALFFLINSAIAILSPEVQLSLYGVLEGAGANYMAQWAGLGSVLVALIAWFARKFDKPNTQRKIIFTLMIYFVLAFGISMLGIIKGIMNAIGWPLAILCLFFAIGYSYFYFKKPTLKE